MLETSDPSAALAAFQRTVLVNPKESDAYYEMGRLYLKMGDRKQAAEALGKAVQLSPDDPDYRKPWRIFEATKRAKPSSFKTIAFSAGFVLAPKSRTAYNGLASFLTICLPFPTISPP